MARMEKTCLPRRLTFGELVGGKSYTGEQDKGCIVRLEVEVTEFGMKFEGWRKVAQNAPADGFDESRRRRNAEIA